MNWGIWMWYLYSGSWLGCPEHSVCLHFKCAPFRMPSSSLRLAPSLECIKHRTIPHKGGPCQYVESFHALMWGKPAVSSEKTDDASHGTVPAHANQQTVESQHEAPDPSAPIQPVHRLTKEDHGFVLAVELPGYKAHEFTVAVMDDIRQVVVFGKNPRTGQRIYLAATFSRLGDFKNVAAVLEDGILKVTVGKLKRDGRLVQVMKPISDAGVSG
ncbi:hypothetical protein BJ741DRAFT_380905 [Chytriomyces cf. hyalinus JEL632]|nr:hypothetical protein BJ741DRAFT_380905 [Chytriomyces cf. hyalinus JEL632]